MSGLVLPVERDGYMNGRKVLWSPTKGSQELAMSCEAQQILYSSGRGAGKSTVQLMRFRKTVGQGYGSHWNGLIIDRGYKNLDDLVHKSKQLFTPFNDGAKFYSSKGDLRWVWKTGETLLFRAVEDEDDYQKLHGSSACLYVNDSVNIRGKGDVKIKEVKCGDEILTCEGYKKITRVFPTIKRECNLLMTFDANGEFIGSQIQSTDHRLMTQNSNGINTFSKCLYLSENDQLFLNLKSYFASFLKSHLYTQTSYLSSSRCDSNQRPILLNTLELLQYSCYTFLPFFEKASRIYNHKLPRLFYNLKTQLHFYCNSLNEENYRVKQRDTLLISQQLKKHYSCFLRELAILQPHLNVICQLLTKLNSTFLKFFELSHGRTVTKRKLHSGQMRLLQQQIQALYFELGSDQLLDVSLGQETTTDYLGCYSTYRGRYDELPQMMLNTSQDIVLVEPDVLKHYPIDLQKGDEGYCENNNLDFGLVYIHPYSNKQMETLVPYQVGKSVVVPCGKFLTVDITVDGVNSYYTPKTKSLSSNCYIGFNELTQYPNLAVYDLVSSLNRSGFVPSEHPLPNGTILPEIPMCIFSTSNPSGISGLEVRKRFVDPGRNGEIIKTDVKIFNPRTQQEEIYSKTQCHIFGSYKENDKLDASYVADLESITDPIRRRFWLLGDWSACGEDGGMFNDVWDKTQHIIEPFDIPKRWEITRCMDWGDSSPSSIGYYAESNGEDVRLKNGKTKSTIKGDLFHIGEVYTCLEGYTNKGIKMLPHDLATMLTKYELSQGIYDRVVPGVADTAIYSQIMGNSVAGMMDKPVTIGDKVYPGVKWRRLDSLKKPGSRIDGIKLIRERFANSIVTPLKPYRDKPGLFIFNTCKYYIEIMPMMMRDSKNPDDVDGRNDHICDMQRYKLLSMNTGSKSGKTTGLN